MPIILLAVSLLAMLPGSSPARADSEVLHEVSFPALHQQYIHLRSTFPVTGPEVTIRMANWNPGSYLIRDFASNVDRISFQGPSGESLGFEKTTKNSWQVSAGDNQWVVAEYDVHAGDLSVNTSWASDDYILINPASVFVYSDTTRDLPHRLRLEVPESSGRVLTSMTAFDGAFQAANFDELVDSPVVISDALIHRFNDEEQEYFLVNVGSGGLWDGAQSAQDLQAVVRATNQLWSVTPFDRPYWFFNFLVERGGGLEHDHGTVIMGSRWQMRQREDYIKWLSLAAHEYFHAWNVRRMRPQGLARYDYEDEQYSGALWLAEGVTSYYDNLLLSRAHLLKPDEYFKRLAIDLHGLELTPGRNVISLQQASRDSWIRHYQQDSNSVNSTISYYTKGAVLGFVLDTRLRRESDEKSSLDDVMRLMYQRWGQTPYPDGAFLDAVAEIGGIGIRQWLEPLLQTPGELSVDDALAWYGLVLDRHPVNNAARLTGLPLGAGFGVNWDKEQKGLIIGSVIEGMSGSKAGLLPGDELLAIDGERITEELYDDRMLRLRPGERVTLLLSRRGRIMELPVSLEEARPANYEIKVDPDFGKRELRRLESWLGQALQARDG